MRQYVIVAGILRRGQDILLVRHNGDFGSKEFWTLPGGTANDGENAQQALRREVREEAGLHVTSFKHLAYIGQHLNFKRNWQTSIFAFEVSAASRAPARPQDPDGDIIEAQFFPLPEALCLLEQGPFRVIKEPALHYLSRKTRAQDLPFWIYHEGRDGKVRAVQRPEP